LLIECWKLTRKKYTLMIFHLFTNQMLSLKNITFAYKNWLNLFEDINFDINKWDIIGLYGPSGIWKTSLLKIIWWLLKPTIWEVFYNWENVFDIPYSQLAKYRNDNIGFIFQNFNLLTDFKAVDNIMLPYTIWKIQKEFDQKWFDFLINFFDVKKLLSKTIKNISWWERQRISIIKALIHKPWILLMDEPTTYLNIELGNKFYDLIQNYSKENICVFVSHDEFTKKFFNLEKKLRYWEIKIYKNNQE